MDIQITNLCKSFGDKVVLRGLNGTFKQGKLTCIMGSSGCGKTTLLGIFMGLEKPNSGQITGLPSDFSVVFQENRLCENLTAVGNIALLTGKKVSQETIEAHLTQLDLKKDMYAPVQTLSGGMRRRVAIARGMLCSGDCVYLDEPFKELDGVTRQRTMDYVLEHGNNRTIIAVVHDEREAAYLGGAIFSMTNKEPEIGTDTPD